MDLTEVREKARERMKGYCGVYKVCDGEPERLCQGIKYGKPIGMGGVGIGSTFTSNVEALNRLRLKTRLITPHVEPDMKASFLGHHIPFPIFCTSMSGVKISMGGVITELEFARAVITGCKKVGTIGFIGDGAETYEDRPGLQAIQEAGGWGVQILKPREQKVLLGLIQAAEKAGAIAVGVDMDGAGSVHKSQGSEYPVVILTVTTQHYLLLQRNLIYTGMTRAKKLVVFVGTKKALAIAIKNNRPQLRYTHLAGRLKS